MKRLPRSVEELRVLRAARWVRESTRGQFDNFGPAAQREAQERAIVRYGMTDTGLEWTVAHSGRTIGTTGDFGAMLAAAGTAYDVLVVGYVSRFSRDLRTAVNARHDLHRAGAVMLFAEERLLSSDEESWDSWAREAVEAESYSRRLARNITSGYAAKFRTMSDQAGTAPFGFRRTETTRVLEPDPATIGQAVAIFRLYATGSMSEREVAVSLALGPELVAKALRSPIYNGWVRRHRGPDEERRPAPWRANPPVSDDLWNRCADLRERRHRGGGPSKRNDRDLLRGLLFCAACDRRLRADGTMGTPPRRRVTHPDRCEGWGSRDSAGVERWEGPIAAQWAAIRLDARTLTRVRRLLSAPVTQPTDTTRARLDRAMRDLAGQHVDGRITDAVYLARLATLREEAAAAVLPKTGTTDPDRAIRQIVDMGRAWPRMTEQERAKLTHAVYSRIEVRRDSPDARVLLTPAAYDLGLDQALPESVLVRPRLDSENHVRPVRIEIVGRRERAAMARTA